MAKAIYKIGMRFPLLPVSAKTSKGITNFNTALERILSCGDKYTY